jgi:glycopeptide antibiotics resistance protein
MLTPGDQLPDAHYFNLQDKLIHVICFSVLSFLWTGVGIKKSESQEIRKRLILNFILFGVLAGIVLETLQLYIPNRTFDIMDMIVNEIGGILGFLAYFKIPTNKIGLD